MSLPPVRWVRVYKGIINIPCRNDCVLTKKLTNNHTVYTVENSTFVLPFDAKRSDITHPVNILWLLSSEVPSLRPVEREKKKKKRTRKTVSHGESGVCVRACACVHDVHLHTIIYNSLFYFIYLFFRFLLSTTVCVVGEPGCFGTSGHETDGIKGKNKK